LRLLLDHNLSYAIAEALQLLYPEHHIVALQAKFPRTISDVDFIRALHKEGGWAVLTKDLGTRTRPHERAALDSADVVFFYLDGAWRKFAVPETAARLIRLVPKIAAQTELTARGRFALPINYGSKLRPHRD